MDQADHPQRDQRILRREPNQLKISQRTLLPRQDTDQEHRSVRRHVVDADLQAIPGCLQVEVELDVQIGEGRDVEFLRHDPTVMVSRRFAGWLPPVEPVRRPSARRRCFPTSTTAQTGSPAARVTK